MPNTFAERYRAAMRETGGCPIEAGLLGRLADHECAPRPPTRRPHPKVRLLAAGERNRHPPEIPAARRPKAGRKAA